MEKDRAKQTGVRVLNWIINNFCCWKLELYTPLRIRSPDSRILPDFNIELFPRGPSGTENSMTVRLVTTRPPVMGIIWGDISLIRSDGSVFYSRSVDSKGETSLYIRVRGPRFDEIIRRKGDSLTVKYRSRASSDRFETLFTFIDVVEVALKISNEELVKLSAFGTKLATLTYMSDRGVVKNLVLLGSTCKIDSDKFVFELSPVSCEEAVSVLVRSTVVCGKRVEVTEQQDYTFRDAGNEWIFSILLSKEQVVDEKSWLMLNFKMIPKSYKHGTRPPTFEGVETHVAGVSITTGPFRSAQPNKLNVKNFPPNFVPERIPQESLLKSSTPKKSKKPPALQAPFCVSDLEQGLSIPPNSLPIVPCNPNLSRDRMLLISTSDNHIPSDTDVPEQPTSMPPSNSLLQSSSRASIPFNNIAPSCASVSVPSNSLEPSSASTIIPSNNLVPSSESESVPSSESESVTSSTNASIPSKSLPPSMAIASVPSKTLLKSWASASVPSNGLKISSASASIPSNSLKPSSARASAPSNGLKPSSASASIPSNSLKPSSASASVPSNSHVPTSACILEQQQKVSEELEVKFRRNIQSILSNGGKTLVDVRTLLLLENIFYTGQVDARDAVRLYRLAVKYHNKPLLDKCSAVLCSRISIPTLADVLYLGKRYQDVRLIRLAMNFLLNNYNEVLATEEWKRLTAKHPELVADILTWFGKNSYVTKNQFR